MRSIIRASDIIGRFLQECSNSSIKVLLSSWLTFFLHRLCLHPPVRAQASLIRVLIRLTDSQGLTSDIIILGNNTLVSEATNSTNLTNLDREPHVHGCSFTTAMVEHAYYLAKGAVSVARNDVDHGLGSTHGFKALFKDKSSVYPIKYYLNSMYDYKGMVGLKPYPTRFLRPNLVCVIATTYIHYKDLRLGYDPWVRCQHPYPAGQPPQAFYAEGTAFIFLCPGFLAQSPVPAPNNCPEVMHNTWVGNADIFYRNYQVYTLLYELIRFYLGANALSPYTLPSEQFEWNSCVHYSAVPSVKNPTNLLLYMACKFTPGNNVLPHPTLERGLWLGFLLTKVMDVQWRSNNARQRPTLTNHLSLHLG